MTLVSALKLTPDSAVIVADRLTSHGSRKYLRSRKIREIKSNDDTFLMVSRAGTIHLSNWICRETKAKVTGKDSVEDLIKYLQRSVSEVKKKHTNNILLKQFGLTETNFILNQMSVKKGKSVPIPLHLLEAYKSKKKDLESDFDSDFLFLARDKSGVELYLLKSSGLLELVEAPYETIGVAGYQADDQIQTFLDQKPMEKWNELSLFDGLSTLVEVNYFAKQRFNGVDGVPYICVVWDNQAIIPDYNPSVMIEELVMGVKWNCLSKEFAEDALDALIYHDEDWKNIDHQIWTEAKDGEKLNFLYRKYRF